MTRHAACAQVQAMRRHTALAQGGLKPEQASVVAKKPRLFPLSFVPHQSEIAWTARLGNNCLFSQTTPDQAPSAPKIREPCRRGAFRPASSISGLSLTLAWRKSGTSAGSRSYAASQLLTRQLIASGGLHALFASGRALALVSLFSQFTRKAD